MDRSQNVDHLVGCDHVIRAIALEVTKHARQRCLNFTQIMSVIPLTHPQTNLRLGISAIS